MASDVSHAVFYDCEFLTCEGALRRFWCGPHDPDPVVAQIGAVRLELGGQFEITDTHRSFVVPKDRSGARAALDPYFTELTGVTERDITEKGRSLGDALKDFDAFSQGARLWSWGKDEFHLIAISCFVEGIAPPIPVQRFGNVTGLMLKAGMPYEDIKTTASSGLAAYFGVAAENARLHDALDDAMSVALAVQHLLREEALHPSDIR